MITLGYFTLETADIDKARAFYGEVFGWTFDEASSHATYAHVADSDPPFGFVKAERPRDMANLYFKVEDIRAVSHGITAAGGRAAAPSESATGLSATVSDDQGFSFSLWQPAAGY